MREVLRRAPRRAAVAGMVLALLAAEAVPASTPETVLVASDGKANDRFGYSLAVSGDTLVVGAPGANAAYVFRRTSGVWSQDAKLTGTGGEFGYSVAIDGDTIVVGAPGNFSYQGAAFVFRRSGTSWSQEAKLTNGFGASWDVFGEAVAVSGDTAMIGAPLEGAYDDGAVYIRTRSGTSWFITPVPNIGADNFGKGSSIALQGDTAVWCAARAGRCRLLTRTGGTWAWSGSIITGWSYSDTQDLGVALDGDTIVVAGRNATDVYRLYSGVPSPEAHLPGALAPAIKADTLLLGGTDEAFVYLRSGETWDLRARIPAIGAGGTAWSDGSVAVEGDQALVGAPRRDSSAGAVLVFDLHFPAVAVAPTDVPFARTPVGFEAPADIVTVSNGGERDLHVSSVSIEGGDSGDFRVASGGPAPAPSLAPTVAPGTSVTFAVTFAPQATGPRSSALRLVSDDPLDPILDVALHGESSACVASPVSGTVGTVVAVRGRGFGTRKGKLLVLGGKKPLSLKVTRWNVGDDDVVLGVITKALPAGDYHVCVAPRGAEQIVDPAVFALAAPTVLDVSPARGPAGTEVVATCAALGTAKGSVYLQAPGSTRRLRCKVMSWPRDAASATGQGEVRFRVPKELASGTAYSVLVANGIGEGRAVGAFMAAP